MPRLPCAESGRRSATTGQAMPGGRSPRLPIVRPPGTSAAGWRARARPTRRCRRPRQPLVPPATNRPRHAHLRPPAGVRSREPPIRSLRTPDPARRPAKVPAAHPRSVAGWARRGVGWRSCQPIYQFYQSVRACLPPGWKAGGRFAYNHGRHEGERRGESELGPFIAAFHEGVQGGLRALFPLAGRSLIEYQARCAAAVGAAPIVVMVERIPAALQEAFERLRAEGITVVPVSDGSEAASRLEAGDLILPLADGL